MPLGTLGKAAVLLSAAGATMALALPATAQAATSTPAVHSATVRPHGEIEFFTGFTFPDTAAGLAACEAKGNTERSEGEGSPTCILGDPDAGMYGLFVLRPI
jgi:hypothetical protein